MANLVSDLLDEIEQRSISMLQNQTARLINTVNRNTNLQKQVAKSDLSSKLSSLNLQSLGVEQQRLQELSNTELQNLTSRNELKSLSAVSGGKVVGAENIQETYEQVNLSNVNQKFENLQKDVLLQEGDVKVQNYQNLKTIEQNRINQLSQISSNFQSQLFNTKNKFEEQKNNLQLLQESQQKEEERQNLIQEQQQNKLLESQNNLNILKSYNTNTNKNNEDNKYFEIVNYGFSDKLRELGIGV